VLQKSYTEPIYMFLLDRRTISQSCQNLTNYDKIQIDTRNHWVFTDIFLDIESVKL